MLNPKIDILASIIELETGAKNVKIDRDCWDSKLVARVTDSHSYLWSKSYFDLEIPLPRVEFTVEGNKYHLFVELKFNRQETVGPFSSTVTHTIDEEHFLKETIRAINERFSKINEKSC